MSEYQYVAFRAVDQPLTDEELEFAEQQSSRANITRWSFENEYHFGDFRGDVEELLRHGYDVHLHYANFGVRRVAMRLPAGLPFPESVWSSYLNVGELTWTPDPKGGGGILSLEPFHDAGLIDELYEPDAYLDDVVEVRKRLIPGDLRMLYILWLCGSYDDQSFDPDSIEPPVPGGLAECVKPCGGFLEFFGLDPLMLLAAAENAPPFDRNHSPEVRIAEWLKQLGQDEARSLLGEFLLGDAAAVKSRTLSAIHQSAPATNWPTAELDRSLQQLFDRTEMLREDHEAKEKRARQEEQRRAAEEEERARQERMQKMVEDPSKWIRQATKLVEARGTHNYQAAAELLADLREAVGGEEGERMARKHADYLVKKHPTLNLLKSSLRKQGLFG